MSIVADLGMVIKPPPSGGLGKGLQYAAFYTLKGHLLQRERRPFATLCMPGRCAAALMRGGNTRQYAPAWMGK